VSRERATAVAVILWVLPPAGALRTELRFIKLDEGSSA
jgi:hypothetical protein